MDTVNLQPQPYGIEIYEADGIWLKQMVFAKADVWVPQHSHAYDHLTMLVTGAIKVWKDGVFDAEYRAPVGIHIKAGVKHLFHVIEVPTVIWCVHNLHGAAAVEILAEHHLLSEVA